MKKYTFWSNFKFAYGPVWKEKKSYIRDMIGEIILSVAVPIMGSGLSALVIMLLGNELGIGTIMLCIGTAFIGYALVNAAIEFITSKHSAHNIELRIELFFIQIIKKLINMPLQESESAQNRKLYEKSNMAICTNTGGIEGFFRYSSSLCVSTLGLITYTLIVGSIHPLIIILLLGLSILSAYIHHLPGKYEEKVRNQMADERITMGYIDKVVDDIPGGKDIRVFGLDKWLTQKYDGAIKNSRKLSLKKNLLAYLAKACETTFDAVRNLICYVYLIMLLKNGMSVAEFAFYLGIIAGFSSWFNQVSYHLVKLKECSHSVSEMRQYIDLDAEDEKSKAIPTNQFEKIEIVFEHVFYQYENSDVPVLEDVSFTLKEGEHKALVGLNGAGKSTLVKLMTGLYLPTKGHIYVNGIDTRMLNKEAYFKHQAAVFQEAFTTAYSIAENVAMEEEWDEKRVWESLSQVGLYEKVKGLDKQLETYLGKDLSQEGISLSGGETQKLLLARAIYRNPALVVLDEPTAALDALAEAEVYELYAHTLRERTALFISHRLASTRFCDEIILLADGKIAECGTHDALMEKQGIYYELFKVQSKYYEQGDERDVC